MMGLMKGRMTRVTGSHLDSCIRSKIKKERPATSLPLLLCLIGEIMKKLGFYILNLLIAFTMITLIIMSIYNSLSPENFGPQSPNLFWKYGVYIVITLLLICHARSRLFLVMGMLAVWAPELVNLFYSLNWISGLSYLAILFVAFQLKLPKSNS